MRTLTTIDIDVGELPVWKPKRVSREDGTEALLVLSEDSSVAITGRPEDIGLWASSLLGITGIAGKAETT